METDVEGGGRRVRAMAVGAVLAALGVLVLPTGLAGQAGPGPGAEALRPDGSRIRTGSRTYRMQVIRDGKVREAGTYRIAVERVADGPDAATWLVVQRTDVPGGPGTIVDSVWLEKKTLLPLRQVSHSPRGDLRLEYGHREVRGTRLAPGGERTEIRESFDAPRHSASVLGPLLQTLPLRRGLKLSLPVFDPDRGEVEAGVKVTGTESVELPDDGTVRAWVVEVSVGERTATRWMHAGSGVELRTRSPLPGGGFFEQRLTAFGEHFPGP